MAMAAVRQFSPAVPRRDWLRSVSATGAALAVGGAAALGQPARAADGKASEPETGPSAAPPRPAPVYYKAVKWGMIEGADSVLARFQLCKELGYDGMELVSPADFMAKEVRAASDATGLPVHGLVNMKHWEVRLSSPDAQVRDQAVDILRQAIVDADQFGGQSVLLVPGAVGGADETHDHVWRRSIDGIRRVLPEASRRGVQVLIETVWNGFCETPDQMRDYLDEIASPWVASYFDLGNMVKFSPVEQWIRTLGARIVKLDIKDWSEAGGFGKIGDGSVNWPEVRQALAEIGYNGWVTAEVEGGPREALADIAARMDRVLCRPHG